MISKASPTLITSVWFLSTVITDVSLQSLNNERALLFLHCPILSYEQSMHGDIMLCLWLSYFHQVVTKWVKQISYCTCIMTGYVAIVTMVYAKE